MTKFLLISEDSEKENLLKEVFPMDEVVVTSDEILIFDILKVEEPDIVIVDGADAIFKNGERPWLRSIDSFVDCYNTISLLGKKYGKDFIFEFQDSADGTLYDDFVKLQDNIGYKVCNEKIDISAVR